MTDLQMRRNISNRLYRSIREIESIIADLESLKLYGIANKVSVGLESVQASDQWLIEDTLSLEITV